MLQLQFMYPTTNPEVGIDGLQLAVDRMVLAVAVAKVFANCKTQSDEIDISDILTNEDKIIKKKKLYGIMKYALNLQVDVDKIKDGKPISDESKRIIETELLDLTIRCGSLSEIYHFLITSQEFYKQIIHS